MEQLGFALESVSNEEADAPIGPVPFVQRFAFGGDAGEVVLTRLLTAEREDLLIRVSRPDGEPADQPPLSIDTDAVGAITDRLREELSYSAQ